MAMDADVLGALMQTTIDGLSDEEKQDRSEVFRALASAVISHIQSSASLSGTVAVGLTSATGGAVTGNLIVPAGCID